MFWNTLFCQLGLLERYFIGSFLILQVGSLQNSVHGDVRYRNAFEGLKVIVANQGWRQLFAGVTINYIRVIAIHSNLFWMSFQHFFKNQSWGPSRMPLSSSALCPDESHIPIDFPCILGCCFFSHSPNSRIDEYANFDVINKFSYALVS